MVVKRRTGSTEFDRGDDATMPQLDEQMADKLAPPLYTPDSSSVGQDVSERSRNFFSWGRSRKGSEDSHSLPSWTASNPQTPSDDERGMRRSLVFTTKKRKSTFSFALMAFCVVGLSLYSNARSTLRIALAEVSELVEFSEKLTHQMQSAERDVRRLERELTALDAMERQREDMEEEKKVLDQASAYANPKLVKEMTAIQRKLKYSANRAEKLKEQVQEISKRDSILKYGDGVKHVEVELIFPGHLDGPSTFVVEMAPLDLMPHSVFTFLEMASSGLLNGCSFILNALHVIKAAPLPYDGSPPNDKAQDFLDRGLESVAFREYSAEYPHRRYTVGFAADGSPSFYINTEDNTEIHVGDPCFAKIVSGFDTIKRLESSPTRNGIWFEHRIGIKRATVLN
mmetsp:Transcript_15658/g.24520  ORF Transcript_15658/g.24520 Transcript_15658/m.24520 type:complete len:398 (+) Transcript_15658:155-1348(+)|eukprot:CAMPEP_0117044812 /NCGR_PEP_ID=MMETSP0472-20121206/31036_1 /TAXON_ID=693140 ORGANISM="Tiarina fusus, Strain LIS" /NCGR_SAMPLE_ID=MMETSP0472 /ASSEMBLY_ACC=CAM_ASM_000603 /LENGTH=397 /DNA_ID=CAMNT_0004756643 /DNA_START=155 /DNA_END=1348 /DNA_ORIENTATION=+